MSPRGTAEILALAVVLVPNAAGASDPDRLGNNETTASRPADSPLRLVWLDVSKAAVGVEGVARSEVRSIFEEAGLNVSWRRGRGGEAGRPGEIRIVLVDRLLVESSGRPVLGATPTRPRGHPLVWIHTRSVRAALALPRGSENHQLPVMARRNLGVALGRVIAHEIIHALVPSLHHGNVLMAESLTRLDLTAPRLSVAPAVALAVRGAFDGSLPPRGEAGLLAAERDIPPAMAGLTAELEGRTRSEAGRDPAR